MGISKRRVEIPSNIKGVKMSEIFRIFWPSEPDPQSWYTDVPNEGIIFRGLPQGPFEIYECKSDYHGAFIWPCTDWHNLSDPDMLKEHPLYRQAVLDIRQVNCKYLNLNYLIYLLCDHLGFREVVEDNDINYKKYWKWADKPATP